MLLVPVPIRATGTVPDAILEPFKLVKDAPLPLNDVAVSAPVDELNVRLLPLCGVRLPVAACVNNTLHEVSED